MKMGMYTREIRRNTVEELFDEIKRLEFNTVQLDFQSVPEIGEELPLAVDSGVLRHLKAVLDARGITVAALNGTFNMCAHDPETRADNITRFETLAKSCAPLDCDLITLCTGSRNPGYPMRWRYHPDNNTPEAWEDVLWSGHAIGRIAKKYGIRLGIEIESTLVVGTPEKAIRFFAELGEDAEPFGVIYDASNLYVDGLQTLESMHELMDRTFKLVGDRVLLAHGKDLLYGEGLRQNGCGLGMIDYDYYLQGLKRIGYTEIMIIHGIKNEADFPYCSNFMKKKLQLNGLW